MPIPAADVRLLVFDLDGTLIDSRLDLCNSVNAMLSYCGRHSLTDDVISSFIGDGAAMLVRRALGDPDDEEFVQNALTYFLDYYREHKLDHTTVYPGVMDSLARIHAARPEIAMAVLTNKPVRPSRDICDHFGISQYLFQNYGGNSFPTKKPDPLGLLTLISEAAAHLHSPVTPRHTVLIGDSEVDVFTAHNAGAWSLGCSYGLSPHTLANAPPNLIVHDAADWPAALGIAKI